MPTAGRLITRVPHRVTQRWQMVKAEIAGPPPGRFEFVIKPPPSRRRELDQVPAVGDPTHMVDNRVLARSERLLPYDRSVARRVNDPSRDRFVSSCGHSVERKGYPADRGLQQSPAAVVRT